MFKYYLFGAAIIDVFNIITYDYDIIGVLYYWIINIFTSLIFIKMFGWIERSPLDIKE
jgi:hypothetical protein